MVAEKAVMTEHKVTAENLSGCKENRKMNGSLDISKRFYSYMVIVQQSNLTITNIIFSANSGLIFVSTRWVIAGLNWEL